MGPSAAARRSGRAGGGADRGDNGASSTSVVSNRRRGRTTSSRTSRAAASGFPLGGGTLMCAKTVFRICFVRPEASARGGPRVYSRWCKIAESRCYRSRRSRQAPRRMPDVAGRLGRAVGNNALELALVRAHLGPFMFSRQPTRERHALCARGGGGDPGEARDVRAGSLCRARPRGAPCGRPRFGTDVRIAAPTVRTDLPRPRPT